MSERTCGFESRSGHHRLLQVSRFECPTYRGRDIGHYSEGDWEGVPGFARSIALPGAGPLGPRFAATGNFAS